MPRAGGSDSATATPSEQVSPGGTTPNLELPEPDAATSATPRVEPIPVVHEAVERPPAPWDEIALAPETVGWYDIDTTDLPDDLAARLGAPSYWDISYMMNHHDQLNLIEIAPDVTSLTCSDMPVDIIADDHLDHRRFAVTPCDNPHSLEALSDVEPALSRSGSASRSTRSRSVGRRGRRPSLLTRPRAHQFG